MKGLPMFRTTGDVQRIVLYSGCVCFLCVLFLMVSGCTPLRKKFTRQKKKDKDTNQQFIPVLDPVDYPERIQSSRERYKYHYSLWKVWNKDFLQVLEVGDNDKRQEYLLNQIMEQLHEMHQWLADDQKRAQLAALINDLRKVQEEYGKPSSMRNKFTIRKKVERNAKSIRLGFAPGLVFSDDGS